MPTKPCLSCGKPLGRDGDCSTPYCMYNPNTELEEFGVEQGENGFLLPDENNEPDYDPQPEDHHEGEGGGQEDEAEQFDEDGDQAENTDQIEDDADGESKDSEFEPDENGDDEGEGESEDGEEEGEDSEEGDGQGDQDGDTEDENADESTDDPQDGDEGESEDEQGEDEDDTCPTCNGECEDEDGDPCPDCNGTGKKQDEGEEDEDDDGDDDEDDDRNEEDSDDDLDEDDEDLDDGDEEDSDDEEEEEEEDEEDPDDDDKDENLIVCRDTNGKPVKIGQRLRVQSNQHNSFAQDQILLAGYGTCINAKHQQLTRSLRFLMHDDGPEWEYKPSWLWHNDRLAVYTIGTEGWIAEGCVLIEDDRKKKKDEQDENKNHERSEGLTKTQFERFVNLSDRIFRKVSQTFGTTIEDEKIRDVMRDVIEKGDASREIEIASRGVIYKVSIYAQKED